MNKIIQIIKACSYAIALPSICIFIFISISQTDGTFDEYELLTKKKGIANGVITSASESQNEIEQDASGRTRTTYYYEYNFNYTFFTQSGKKIKSSGIEYQHLPLNKEMEEIPYKIKVEYVLNNPLVNRVQNLSNNNDSIIDWFQRQILPSLISFLFCIYISYIISKSTFDKIKNKI